MNLRNRAEGWQYAKLTGHQRELDVAAELSLDVSLSSWLHLQYFGTPEVALPRVETSGISMERVPSVLGGLTVPKTDLEVEWPARAVRVSLKKSKAGQVWLVSLDRFVRGFEAQFSDPVPDAVREGLRLFIGPLDLAEMEDVLAGHPPQGPRSRSGTGPQEFHQRRFVARTLEQRRPEIWEATLQWLQEEMPRLAELCFARGLARDEVDYADAVVYSLVERGEVRNFLFPLTDLVEHIQNMQEEMRAQSGPRQGGSTIITPFGFLQMHNPKLQGENHHRNQLQFHHRLKDLLALFSWLPGEVERQESRSRGR